MLNNHLVNFDSPYHFKKTFLNLDVNYVDCYKHIDPSTTMKSNTLLYPQWYSLVKNGRFRFYYCRHCNHSYKSYADLVESCDLKEIITPKSKSAICKKVRKFISIIQININQFIKSNEYKQICKDLYGDENYQYNTSSNHYDKKSNSLHQQEQHHHENNQHSQCKENQKEQTLCSNKTESNNTPPTINTTRKYNKHTVITNKKSHQTSSVHEPIIIYNFPSPESMEESNSTNKSPSINEITLSDKQQEEEHYFESIDPFLLSQDELTLFEQEQHSLNHSSHSYNNYYQNSLHNHSTTSLSSPNNLNQLVTSHTNNTDLHGANTSNDNTTSVSNTVTSSIDSNHSIPSSTKKNKRSSNKRITKKNKASPTTKSSSIKLHKHQQHHHYNLRSNS